MSGEDLLSHNSTFLLHSCGRSVEQAPSDLFHKDMSHLPKMPPPNTIALRIKSQHELRGGGRVVINI